MKKVKCIKPFNELYLRADGSITACCFLNDYTYGHIKDTKLDETATNKNRLKLIEEFETGNVEICKKYMDSCKCNKEGIVTHDDSDHSHPIETLEIALSGSCNLKCPSCHIWKIREFPYDIESFYKSLSKMSHNLRRVIIHGGEPFIQKQVFTVFNLINGLNDKINFEFITNGNWQITKKLSDIFYNPKVEKISFSMDTLDKFTYQKLRVGGALEKVLCNLKWLYENGLKNKVELSMVVQLDNYNEVLSFINHCQSQEVTAKLIFLISPNRLSLRNLSVQEKVELMSNWIQYLNKFNSRELYDCLLKLSVGMNKNDFFEHLPSIAILSRVYAK